MRRVEHPRFTAALQEVEDSIDDAWRVLREAREVDRPNVAAGNEHAIRVSSAVARTRHRYTPRARCGYELALPDLLAGGLPTTAEAQRMKALINKLTDDELERLTSSADLQGKDQR